MENPNAVNAGAFARKTNEISTLVKVKQKLPAINQKFKADLMHTHPIIALHYFGMSNPIPTISQKEGN